MFEKNKSVDVKMAQSICIKLVSAKAVQNQVPTKKTVVCINLHNGTPKILIDGSRN